MKMEYVAGLLDGEGCIQIVNNSKKMGSLRLQVSIRNSHKGVIQALKKQFGGSIGTTKAKGNRSTSYQWIITSRGASKFLVLITPHLIIKKPEARIALRFQKTMTSWGGHLVVSPKAMALRLSLTARIKALKRAYREYA